MDFAAQRDVSEHSLWKWRKRLEDDAAVEVGESGPRFVAVSVNTAERGAVASSTGDPIQGPVELELAGGRTLRLKGAVDVSTLVSLVRELSSC